MEILDNLRIGPLDRAAVWWEYNYLNKNLSRNLYEHPNTDVVLRKIASFTGQGNLKIRTSMSRALARACIWGLRVLIWLRYRLPC